MDRFLVRMWDSKYKKMWTFENDGFLECVFECLKQQLAYESRLKILENISYNHIADGRVFMRSTGLTDKKCVLVYEHDLIKFDDDNRIFEVFWDKSNFCWALGDVKTKDIYSLAFINHYNIEVIGNIHENKDLLEANND